MSEEKTTRLYVRVTAKQKELIRNLTQESGLVSTSEYVRQMALTGQVIKKEYTGLKELAAQIGKIGSNVNQIAKRANERRLVPQGDIDAVMRYLKQILRLLDRQARQIIKS